MVCFYLLNSFQLATYCYSLPSDSEGKLVIKCYSWLRPGIYKIVFNLYRFPPSWELQNRQLSFLTLIRNLYNNLFFYFFLLRYDYIDSCFRRNDNNIVNYIDPAFRERRDDKKMRKFANQIKMGIYLKTSFALF